MYLVSVVPAFQVIISSCSHSHSTHPALVGPCRPVHTTPTITCLLHLALLLLHALQCFLCPRQALLQLVPPRHQLPSLLVQPFDVRKPGAVWRQFVKAGMCSS